MKEDLLRIITFIHYILSYSSQACVVSFPKLKLRVPVLLLYSNFEHPSSCQQLKSPPRFKTGATLLKSVKIIFHEWGLHRSIKLNLLSTIGVFVVRDDVEGPPSSVFYESDEVVLVSRARVHAEDPIFHAEANESLVIFQFQHRLWHINNKKTTFFKDTLSMFNCSLASSVQFHLLFNIVKSVKNLKFTYESRKKYPECSEDE